MSAATSADDQIVIDGTRNYDYAKQVLTLVNEQRAANGEAAFSLDAELTEAAMMRAAECALYFSHTRPDGTSCFAISSNASGENIASLYTAPDGVMYAWMNSSGHKANILGSGYQSIGIGCFQMENMGNGYFWVQIFGYASASGSVPDGTVDGSYTVNLDYETVPLDIDFVDIEFGYLSNPKELGIGETLQMTVEQYGYHDDYKYHEEYNCHEQYGYHNYNYYK